jgi:hypothetical protein
MKGFKFVASAVNLVILHRDGRAFGLRRKLL